MITAEAGAVWGGKDAGGLGEGVALEPGMLVLEEGLAQIDFFGNSDQGQLRRVETLKSGMFWHVWVQFFQHTDINRVGEPANADAATEEVKEQVG